MQHPNRIKKLYLGLAILLLTLGIGNLAFGKHKKAEYIQILSEAKAGVTIPELGETPFSKPTYDRYVDLDRQQKHLERVQSRVNFYEFVMLGGKALLGLAGIFLLAWLATPKRTEHS